MATPSLIVEIAFASNPLATPSWTDVSQYVRAFSIRRGRQRELDRIEAGTATVTLDNRDRRFDPTNQSSPYYPNVIPMRRLRISAIWNAVTYRLFTGFVESWPQRWPEFGDAVVEVQCADLFKLLNLFQISNLAAPQESSGARVNRILDSVGWPAAERAIDTGQSQVQAGTVTNISALQHLQTVAETEAGMFFVAGDGKPTFRNRHARILPSSTAAPVFGDATGELPYAELTIEYTDDQLWNLVTVSRLGGTTPGQAQDTASQAQYASRALSKQKLLQTTDSECQAAAEYLVNRYARPQLVMRTLSLEPQMSDALWPQALGRELGDRVVVRRRPPGGGAILEQISFVEGIAWDVTRDLWQTAWQLSPADIETYWILAGTDTDQYAAYSKLGQTTRLAY